MRPSLPPVKNIDY